MTFPAFKEWHVIVEALGAGEQILILRKGGIAENPGGFQVESRRFWLFPTRFHAQLEKTKPAAARWFATASASPATANAAASSSAAASAAGDTVTLRHFADLVDAAFLSDWETVRRLDAQHLWSEACIHERFQSAAPHGLHALIVRVHQLARPLTLPLTPAMAGCRSWIELPAAFDAQPSAPVLDDAAFARRRATLSL